MHDNDIMHYSMFPILYDKTHITEAAVELISENRSVASYSYTLFEC